MRWTPFKDFHKVVGSDFECNPSFVRTLFTNLSLLKLVARFLHIARNQVFHAFAYSHWIYALCNPFPSPMHYLQGFVFDTDAVTLESGAPVTRIMATCTPNIIQVRIRFRKRK